jgi:hypothetical protein
LCPSVVTRPSALGWWYCINPNIRETDARLDVAEGRLGSQALVQLHASLATHPADPGCDSTGAAGCGERRLQRKSEGSWRGTPLTRTCGC